MDADQPGAVRAAEQSEQIQPAAADGPQDQPQQADTTQSETRAAADDDEKADAPPAAPPTDGSQAAQPAAVAGNVTAAALMDVDEQPAAAAPGQVPADGTATGQDAGTAPATEPEKAAAPSVDTTRPDSLPRITNSGADDMPVDPPAASETLSDAGSAAAEPALADSDAAHQQVPGGEGASEAIVVPDSAQNTNIDAADPRVAGGDGAPAAQAVKSEEVAAPGGSIGGPAAQESADLAPSSNDADTSQPAQTASGYLVHADKGGSAAAAAPAEPAIETPEQHTETTTRPAANDAQGPIKAEVVDAQPTGVESTKRARTPTALQRERSASRPGEAAISAETIAPPGPVEPNAPNGTAGRTPASALAAVPNGRDGKGKRRSVPETSASSAAPAANRSHSDDVRAQRTPAPQQQPTQAYDPYEAAQRAREQEQLELQRQIDRENEEARMLWLSLPGNDHPSYYSDTDASSHGGRSRASTISDSELIARETAPYVPPPRLANGHHDAATTGVLSSQLQRNQLHDLDEELEESAMRASLIDPLQHGVLAGAPSGLNGGTKRRAEFMDADELESDLEEQYATKQQKMLEMHKYRRGNRGNKLKRKEGSRWARTKKLGTYTEARNDKEVNDRIRVRIAALQRAGVRALLNNAPEPVPELDDPSLDDPLPYDLDDGEPLTSTALASALLRPILTARALLESHTLKHTFRNPHIGALSRTAMDLRESESVVSRALGRSLTAMEGTTMEAEAKEEAVLRKREAQRKAAPPLQLPSSVDGDTSGESVHLENDLIPPNPELDPTFTRLDKLFVTPGGLPIPLPEPLPPGADPASAPPPPPPQAILTVSQQQEVVRAALECLHELAADSKEYVERLDEVRFRLASVKQKRAVVWNAIRVWALARDKRDHQDEEGDRRGDGDGDGEGGEHGSESDADDDDLNYPVSLVAAMKAAAAAEQQMVSTAQPRRRGNQSGSSSRAGASGKRAR